MAVFSEGETLYRFDLASEEATPIATGFLGLMGSSEDASSLYLVSTQALEGAAQAGKPNAYLWRAGEGFTFIATLDPVDLELTGRNPSGDRHLSRFATPPRQVPTAAHWPSCPAPARA